MSGGIQGVLEAMETLLDDMPADSGGPRVFLATYERTTRAVGGAIGEGIFEDPAWVEEWDVVFARLYVDALTAHRAGDAVARPWRLAFEAPTDLPDLRQVLLGINAHINFDLPQALLAVIGEGDFENPALLERRRRDHERIDAVLSARVKAEDNELGAGWLLDRVLAPLNRAGSKRFLREARRKVWLNTEALHRARVSGPDVYAQRLAELELLSAAKIADLLEPGQVLLRLAVAGFGVTLPPPAV